MNIRIKRHKYTLKYNVFWLIKLIWNEWQMERNVVYSRWAANICGIFSTWTLFTSNDQLVSMGIVIPWMTPVRRHSGLPLCTLASTSTSISISTSTSSSTSASASSSCSQRMSRSPGLHSICVSITWNELRPAWPGNGKADEERVLYAKLSQTRLVCQRQMCSIDLSGHKNSPGNANGAGKLVMVLVMVMAFRKDDFQS